jgi:hypothetical protein
MGAGNVRQMGDTTYEYAAVLEFADESGLMAYLHHPLHVHLGEMFWKCCDRSVVSEIRSVDLSNDAAVSKLVE